MRVNGNEIKTGNVVDHKNRLWVVMKTNAVKPGKGGAFNQVELKNLIDGTKLNERFRASETVKKIRLEQTDFQYLYEKENVFVFMDLQTYEHLELKQEFIGERSAFLQDGIQVTVEFYEKKPIGMRFPDYVTLRVIETEPVIKGQTISSSYKPAVIDNGFKIMVPPFVQVGEKIVVDINNITYIRRTEG
ncbi:elongation factor P [Candidatus Endowatersipora endosymbiont of Watersipora subatra]|uniref:elongation factor P n=1 Tax=Candidatus Endowatersipora endosymbiont of Watersipora subatra TaxID=3077946 RepID=UPI00312C72D8